MQGWPNWLYTLWSFLIRVFVFPFVLPVRLYEYIVGNTYPKNLIKKGDAMADLSFKAVSSIFTGIGAVLGAVWAIDTHYASAADLEKVQKSVEAQVIQLRQERVEDELFKLDAKKQTQKGKLDPVEAALYERYSRRIQQTQQELRDKK